MRKLSLTSLNLFSIHLSLYINNIINQTNEYYEKICQLAIFPTLKLKLLFTL